ncbi:MAG: carbamoyltransferase HypF, partial [Candidatus Bipolaricaulota bacterium]
SRCDDSVLRFSGQRRKFLRRSRGWVPSAISVDLGSEPLLSLGAEQDNVIGLYVDGSVYLSQYLGDIDDLESLEFLKESLDRLLKLTDTTLPSKIAHDLHPKFLTTDLAQEQGDLSLGVQHHHAHLGSLLAETSQDQLVGIILDGVGFSENGEIWGGEILTGEGGEYQRVGSLTEARMPGGDLATLYPARMVAGILYPLAESGQISNFEEYLRELDLEFPRGDRELAATVQQLESDVNAPLSTSAGRFLDAVSALLGICSERTYEGEPPMKLESVAREGVARRLKLPLSQRKGRFVLDQSQLFYQLVEMRNRVSVADLAATAQSALARGFAALAIKIAEDREIDTIGLSGGVSYNDSISSIIESEVKDTGYSFTTNKQVPHGDGGLALGQLWVLAHSEKLRG